MVDISQTGAETLFFLKKKLTPPHCIGDRTVKPVRLGIIRTLFNYVARIFTFMQRTINDVRPGAQLKRCIAILYRESPFFTVRHTQNYPSFYTERHTELESWCTYHAFCGILLHLTNKYTYVGLIQQKKYRTITLPVVLYGCKSGLLQEAHKLGECKNRVLRKSFG
jgi:hypothetical protein